MAYNNGLQWTAYNTATEAERWDNEIFLDRLDEPIFNHQVIDLVVGLGLSSELSG